MRKRKIISASKDFSVALLPQNRKDQFFSLLKNQYSTLLKAGFLLLLFFIPYLATDFVRNLFDSGFYTQFTAGSLTEEEYHFYLFFDLMIQSGIEFVFLPLLTVAFAGLNLIFKEMVESEHVLFWADFKLGVKANYKSSIIITMVFGVFFVLVRFIVNYFIGAYFITIPVYSIFVLFIIPLAVIALIFSTYYQGNYFNVLNNSTKLYPHYWWQYLLTSGILFALIYVLNLVFDGYLAPYYKTITYGFMILLLLPIGLLLLHEISISMFDKYVNIIYYPDNYKKGLYQPKSKKSKKDSK